MGKVVVVSASPRGDSQSMTNGDFDNDDKSRSTILSLIQHAQADSAESFLQSGP
jgi:hypothetical protein